MVENLRRSAAEHRCPAAVVVDGRVEVNAALASIVGLPAEALAAPDAWLQRASSPEARRALVGALAGETPAAPVGITREDGRPVALRVACFRAAGAVLWIADDVTESTAAVNERDRFFALSRDLLLVATADGRVARASASFVDVLGYPREDIEGRLLVDLVAPEDREVAVRRFADLFVTQACCDLELRFSCADGTVKWIAWRCPPAEDGRVYAVGRDVTQARLAADARREAERQVHAIFDESPVATAAVSPTGAFLRVNDAFCRLTGYAAAELAAMRFEDLTRDYPEDLGRNLTLFQAAMRGERERYEVEKRYTRKDGATVWVLVTVGVLRGADGEPSGVVAQVQDIDARKRAEDALRASEQQFREFAENLPGVAWLCDARNASAIYVSSRFEELFGRPLADLHDDPFVWYRKDVVAEDRPRVKQAIAALPDRPYEAEYRVRRPDGTTRWVHDRASAVRGPDGSVSRLAGFAQDVTARKTAEEARRASEDRYRRLVAMLPDAVIVLAEDGRIAEANAMAATLCAVDMGALVGRSLAELFDETAARSHVDEIVAQGLSVDGVVGHFARRSDGARLALEVCATPFAEGTAATLLVLRDVTARLDAEAEIARQREELAAVVALREQDARLRQIIDMVPHFIFAKDASGRFLLVNRAVADAFGTTVAELEGKTDADFVDDEAEVAQFRAADQEVLASGRPKLVPEEVLTDASGRVRVLSTVKIPFSFAGSGVAAILGVSTDITEQKALERQLVHAQKMEGMGRLAGGIAHDFNNALSAILSFAELLASELAAEPELQKDAEAIRDVALHAAELTRQLLAFSRLGEAKPTAVDVAELTQKLARVLLHLVGHDVTVDVFAEPGPHVVSIDPSALEQVLVNLAINARDAMPGGGRLSIRVRTVAADAIRDRLGSPADGSWVELSVEDTGRGMDEATMARIFEPFFTTKAVGKGTGLGLATSYGIVRQAGGHLLVESTPNVGTVFRVLLRACEDAAASSRAARTATGSGEAVLVIEDNQFVRETTTRALRRSGYRVIACGTVQEALATLAEPRTRVDIVLTDVVMPEMNGFEVAAEALRLRPGVRLLFVSGYGNDALQSRPDLRARARLLAKPFTATQLAQEVRRALDEEPVSTRAREDHESGAPPARATGRGSAS